MRAWLSKTSIFSAALVVASLGAIVGIARYLRRSGPTDVSESPVYRIGFRNNPPYLIVQEDGSPAGLAVEVVSEAARRAGVRLQWVRFSGLNYEFLDRGAGDLWPLGDVLDSRQYATTRPWIRDSFSLVTRANGSKPTRIAANESPRTLSLLRSAYPQAAVVPRRGAAESLVAVCDGHADGAFANARVLHQLLLARPADCDGVRLRLNHAEGVAIPLGIMFKEQFRAPAEAIRAAIDDMATDGTLGRRFEKWAHSANNEIELSNLLLESEGRARRAWRLAAVFGVALLALLAGTVLLYRAHRLSVSANRAKSTFLAMVSHELRTPLQGIVGVLDLLAKESLTPGQRSLTTTIKVSANSLRRIVGDILEYSRIDAFRFELNPGPTALVPLIEGVVVLLADQADRKGISIELDSPDAFPMVEADGPRVHQLLFNLVDNGIKFTVDGGVTIRLRELEAEAGWVGVCVEVVDSGIGMDAAAVPRMFEAFQQAESGDSRRFGGLGLGLAVCKGIVDQMGGTLGLISTLGNGTTARVTLKLARSKVEAEAPAVQEGAGPLRILVVDDNATNRRVASKMLARMGHSVDLAENGKAAIACWSRGTYDLILMDCQMPVLDGFAATAQIRLMEAEQGRARCPVVALTASVDEQDQMQCIRAGMDGFLGKPVGFEELAGAVRSYRAVRIQG